ncbi:MAG: glutamate--tRNA ligase [Candidatus Doudnabacteria bacterium]|nr:glutamate--tRNA ligase [Candidatus Doudnabacteria bacterium]
MTTQRPIRTRFAPSPTGFLHVGGLRTALYAYLLAKKEGGTFVLRIEDTDQSRSVDGAVENLLETLAVTGIEPDEGPRLADVDHDMDELHVEEVGEHGPYIQSNRLDVYKHYALQLVEQGDAYPCFCTPERLEQMRTEQQKAKQPPKYDRHCLSLSEEEVVRRIEAEESHVLRLRMPADQTITWEDAVRGTVSFESNLIDDQVLLKSDGFPTYHLAVVVDDHLMEITHVIRGEEWLSSTPKHLALYNAFGWEPPIHVHVPLLLNPDKSKLSKRQGDVSVEDFLDDGYLVPALVNFIALLGWNPKSEQELFSITELVEAFSLEDLNKSGAIFDRDKLNWMNGEYIKQHDTMDLLMHAHPFYDEKGLLEEAAKRVGASNKMDQIVMEEIAKSLSIEQTRLEKLSQVGEETDYLFVNALNYPAEDLIWKKSTQEDTVLYLNALQDLLSERPEDTWVTDALEKDVISWIAENNWKNGDVLWPLRVALTGKPKSPGPFESLWALGKERSLERISRAIELLAA